MTNGMDTQKYGVLMRVLECGSLTLAAEELGYTQSGISRILKSLEEELGLALLRRNKGGVIPTENLKRLLPAVRGLLNDEERIRQTASALRGLHEGKLRIGAFTSVSVHWLPQIIKAYENDYPHIEITILGGDYHDVDLWLTEGAIDIGFVTLPSAANCRFIPLKEDRLLAVLPPDHPLAALDRLPVTRIADEPFISLLESSDHDMRKALDAYGIKPNVKFTSKDDYAILAMVENGLGMTIMPELLLEGRRDRVRVMELVPGARRTIALALPSAGATPADFVAWKKWNVAMKADYPKRMITPNETIPGPDGQPRAIGYWQNKDQHTDTVMGTCLCALQLMVYYRYLPTTSLKATEQAADLVAASTEKMDVRVTIDL